MLFRHKKAVRIESMILEPNKTEYLKKIKIFYF